MNFTRKYFKNIKLLLPDILLWLRFPALLSLCAVSSGIVLSRFLVTDIINLSVTYSSLYIILKSAATISLILALFLKKNSARQVFFLIGGASLYSVYVINNNNLYKVIECASTTAVTIHGNVLSPSLANPDNIRFLLRIDSTTPPVREFHNKVIQCISSVRVPQGAALNIHGTLKIPGRQRNAYEFDEYRYLQSNGIMATFRIDTILSTTTTTSVSTSLSANFRKSISAIINRFTDQDHRAIMYAVFLGEPQYLSSYIKNVFRDSGTYHILSISGLHAAMLLAMCYFILNTLPIPPALRHSIALGVLWCYQLFIGFIPCLFRATVMSTIFIFAYILQKKNYTIQALGIAGTAWLCISPDSLFQAGYQLSFAATLGILVLCPVFDACKPSVKNRYIDFFVSKLMISFYVSLAGTLSTLPILLYHFGTLSILGLISNIVAVPAMTCSMWLFFTAIISSLMVPWVVPLCISVSAWFLDILVKSADISTLIPFSSISLSSLPTLFTVFFAAGIVLIAGAVKKIRLQLTISLLLILSCCIGIEWIILQKSNRLVMTRFDLDDASMTAIRDEHRQITLYVTNQSKSDLRWQRIFTSWQRHQRFASLNKVMYASTTRKRYPDQSKWITPFQDSKIHYSFVDADVLSDSIAARLQTYKQDRLHIPNLPERQPGDIMKQFLSCTSDSTTTRICPRMVFTETSFHRIR
jgi:ComEC/Rec2-related protein